MVVKYILKFIVSILLLSLGVNLAIAEQYPAVFEAKKSAILSAQVQGILSDYKVKSGGNVEKGALIVKAIHDDLLEQKKGKEVEIELSDRKLKQSEDLYKRKVISLDEYDQFKIKNQLLKIEKNLINLKIKNSHIRAPFSGKVSKIMIRSHEWVSPGQKVLELIDHDMVAIVHLPSHYLQKVKKKDVRRIYVADIKSSVEVELERISTKVEVKSNTIKSFWKVIKSPELLKPGMRGMIEIKAKAP